MALEPVAQELKRSVITVKRTWRLVFVLAVAASVIGEVRYEAQSTFHTTNLVVDDTASVGSALYVNGQLALTGSGSAGKLPLWTGSSSIGNYAGSACGAGRFVNAFDSTGAVTCGSAGSGTITGSGANGDLALWSGSSSIGNYAGSTCSGGRFANGIGSDGVFACGSAGTLTGSGSNGFLALWSGATAIGNYAGAACAGGQFAKSIGSDGGLTCGSGNTGTITGSGSNGFITLWSGTTSIGNYAGSACSAGQFASAIGSNGGITCGSAGSGTVTGTGSNGTLALWSGTTSIGNYAGSACSGGQFANAIGSNGGVTCGSASGTGTVTSITCGTGLTCTPGSPITSTGTIAVTAVTASMSITNATQAAGVNLSTTGTGQFDWMLASPSQNTATRIVDSFTDTIPEKLTGGGILLTPGVDIIGNTGTLAQSNGTVTFSSTASDTMTQVAISSSAGNGITSAGTNTGFRFVAPVTTTQRVLRIYNSHSNSTWQCTAHLQDGSVTDKTTTASVATTAVEEVQTVTVVAGSSTYLVVYCIVSATTGTAILKWYAEILSAA